MSYMTPAEIAAEAYKQGFTTPQANSTMTAITLAESSGNPSAINSGYLLPNGARSEYSVGLAQVNTLAHPQYSVNELLNPSSNLAAAYQISSGGTNFSAWSTFLNGAYQKYLGVAQAASNSVISGNPQVTTATNSNFITKMGSTGLQTIEMPFQFLNNLLGGAASKTTKDVANGLLAVVESLLNTIPWIPILEGLFGVLLSYPIFNFRNSLNYQYQTKCYKQYTKKTL